MPLGIGTVVDDRYRVVACVGAGSPRELTRIFEQPRQAIPYPELRSRRRPAGDAYVLISSERRAMPARANSATM